ncbi:glycosyltransferase family 4 protein [Martelella radicis]|uniref:Glycosyltransferase involved in cell wall biosynthesis n=1 Tax=Martelella radicis TaxID=1397476 RepID=A0A7W6KNG6_9HYPH|nr:glycosyltransferase family 1 protein [Martelella radicis]MBB4123304.1 glycosyltransferase involved in cell wall biosynthesis [Martelella radicis]
MRLLVDGVFFQLSNSGIARVWRSLLPRLAAFPGVEITVLDRGRSPRFAGVEYIDFPSYTFTSTAADSLLIDVFAKDCGADVFLSTYYTTPTQIPSVLIVYDMIPELFGFDLKLRAWQEKNLAISFAQYCLCISENTRKDLLDIYPDFDPDRVVTAYCGLDSKAFRPREEQEVSAFRKEYKVAEDYCILVGSREQHTGYKNAGLLFESLKKQDQLRDVFDRPNRPEFEVLCVGGEPEIQAHFTEGLPDNITVKRVDLTDDELACAYSGARALVYPSLYEGFGLPVVEAMSCGCPVITTPHGSLKEVAGDAAVLISGKDPGELMNALKLVRNPAKRDELRERGLERAGRFTWEPMAEELRRLVFKAADERASPEIVNFMEEWSRLRRIQADIDVSL